MPSTIHMSSQYGELRHTNGWDWFGSLGHPANFNGFRDLPLLLQRLRSPEANQTLHDVWPSPDWHTIYTFSGVLAPWQNFARCKIHFTFKYCIYLYWQRYCSDVARRRTTKLCTMFGRVLPCYTIYTFPGALAPLTEFFPVQNSLYVQVLRSLILALLLHGTPTAGVSQTLRRWTEGATYIRQGGHQVGHRPTFLVLHSFGQF